MSLSYRATPAVTQSSGNVSSLSVAKQSGTSAGDLILIYAFGAINTGTPSITGFTATAIDGDDIGILFYRVADGTEGSTFTITGGDTTASQPITAGIRTIAGSTGTPTIGTAGNSSSTSFGAPGITMPAAGWVCSFAGNENGYGSNGYAITAPSGYTSQATNGAQSANATMMLADNQSAGSGATGTITSTCTNASFWAGVLVGVVPSASGVTSTGSVKMAPLAPSGTAAETIAASGSAGMAPLAPSGTATSSGGTITSSGSAGMAALAPSGAGAETITGAGSAAMAPLAPSGSGSQANPPIIDATLTAMMAAAYGTVSESGGVASVQCDTGYSSGLGTAIEYDAAGSMLWMELTPYQAASAQTIMTVSDGSVGSFQLGYSAGQLLALLDYPSGTNTTIGSAAYSPTAHQWIRIRESGGTVYFDTAPDGLAWTSQWSYGTEPFSLTGCVAGLYAGDFGADPTGVSYIANVNVVPAPSAVFPLAPLDLRTEIDVGGWTDISALVYQRDGTSPPVSISRGRANEQASATPCSMSAQWNNRSGNLSPRNPTGEWYGLLGRNTPVRLSVPNPVSPALRIADDAVSYASCPGSSALECAADLDIRVDADLDNWAACLLAGQFHGTASMCWSLSLNGDGTLCFTWNDGSSVNQASSTMPMPLGRVAIRCWFDPAGTSGAPQAIFYTAPDMAGSWAQLGNAVAITSADYAVTSASAGLTVGYSAIWEASALGALQYGLQGRVYEVALYNGSTLAADPQFYSQTAGATSFADTQGNTWTLSGSASIDDRSYRVHAECTTLPQRWDSTGRDVWCPVEAKGVLQRIQQGNSPLPSAMRRFCASSAAAGYWGAVAGYWPGEDNQGATQVASGLPSGLPMPVQGSAAFQATAGSKSADSNFYCSAQLGQVQSSTWIGQVPQTSGAGSVFLLLYIPSGTPAATILSVAPMSLIYSTGSGGTLQLSQDVAAGGAETTDISGINGIPLLVQMWNQTGVGGSGGGSSVLTVTPLTGPQNISQVTCSSPGIAVPGIGGALLVNPGGAALGSTEVGHVFAVAGAYDGPGDSPYGGPSSWSPSGYSASVPPAAMVSAATAWFGETAASRFLRLCAENGIAGRVYGYPALTQAMGYQPVDTLANLIQYTEDTDRGQVYEPAEALGIGYRTLGSMCSQAAQLTLDYAAAQLGDGSSDIEPTDDDQYTINDATIERNNGSSAQVQVLTGTMSVNPPPDGVGDYDTQITTYNAWDKDLPDIAGWVTWVGSCDQERYPSIPLNLARPQLASQLAAIVGMRLAGYFQIEHLIAQMPPGTVDQLLYGYTEGLGGFFWTLGLNGVPEDPYDVLVYGEGHYDTAGSELASGVSSTATSLSVATTAGNLWTTSGSDFPFNIMVSGEEMTVTSITGSSSPQAFAVTRSVNGVVKAQLSGAAVNVASAPVYALAGNR